MDPGRGHFSVKRASSGLQKRSPYGRTARGETDSEGVTLAFVPVGLPGLHPRHLDSSGFVYSAESYESAAEHELVAASGNPDGYPEVN